METTPPQGVWYEKGRDRWRVKLFCNGVLFHRSYHREYEAAVAAWRNAKKSMVRPKPDIPIHLSSDINRFLCRPLPGTCRIVSS